MGSLTSPDGGPRDSQKAAVGLLAWLAAGADTGKAVVSAGGCGAGVVNAGGFTGPAHPAVQLQVPRPVTRSYSQRVTAPQRLHGPPTPAGIWSASSRTSWAQPGQSHAGRHAAMPAPCRIGMGAHCISRCGKGTKSTPPACPMAASRWQHNTAIPGGGGGSGASLEVNVRRV